MVKFKIDGYTLEIGDEDLNIYFDIDVQSGMLEISATDDGFYENRIYLKRETAMMLALWLKSRLSE